MRDHSTDMAVTPGLRAGSTAVHVVIKDPYMTDPAANQPELTRLIDAIKVAYHLDGTDSLPAIQAISKLAPMLEDDDPTSEQSQGIACLMNALKTGSNVSLMVHAMSVLARIQAPAALPVLVDVLLASRIDIYENTNAKTFVGSDNSLRLRCAAAQSLGKFGDEQAIIPLMSILNDRTQNYRLRLACAESLGKIGHDHAVNPLLDILQDEREKSIYVKESAVKALGMLGDIRAIEPLIQMLESKRGIRDKFNFLKEQIIEAIARIGSPTRKATDNLIYALSDEAPSIRLAAVEALGEIGDEDCIPMLEKLVFDANDEVACAAIHSIYHLGGEDEIKRLLSTLENLPQFLREELESYIP